jgi:uncharacterized protein (TIGR03437 family)
MDSAASLPLPTRLAGVTVNVLDSFGPSRPAGLIFVSPTQVNFVVPMLTASGTAIVTVTRDGATVAQALVLIPRQLAGRGEVGLTLQACGSAANPVLIHIR